MKWYLTHRGDLRANALAKQHYTCQSPDSDQFVTPGRCMVLLTEKADALWVTSYPFAEFVHHEWAGAWNCSIFRNTNQYNRKNKDGHLSSELIREAVAVTRWYAMHDKKWQKGLGDVPYLTDEPVLGMITFVNREMVKPKTRFGECYLQAGFEIVGETKVEKHLALQLKPENMPEPMQPLGWRAKALALEKRVVRPMLIA